MIYHPLQGNVKTTLFCFKSDVSSMSRSVYGGDERSVSSVRKVGTEKCKIHMMILRSGCQKGELNARTGNGTGRHDNIQVGDVRLQTVKCYYTRCACDGLSTSVSGCVGRWPKVKHVYMSWSVCLLKLSDCRARTLRYLIIFLT